MATARFQLLVLLEETLELVGVGLFIVILWSLLERLPWRIESQGSPPA